MPILIKDFTWTQSAAKLQIKIPLKSKRNDIDVFTADSYVKIHFNPFLFEIFLLHDVDNNRSTCILQDDIIVLDMFKKEENLWECLEKCLSKEEKKEMRQKILEKCQEEAKERAEQKTIKKSQMDRFAVQQAMEIDSQQHSLMDKRRDAECNKAMVDLEVWRDTVESNKNISSVTCHGKKQTNQYFEPININKIKPYKNDTSVKIIELPASDEEKDVPENNKNTTENRQIKQNSKILNNPDKTQVRSKNVEKKKKEAVSRVLPKLRETRELEIKHTPRSFPTPSRESAVQEEEAWLKNITQARRAIGYLVSLKY